MTSLPRSDSSDESDNPIRLLDHVKILHVPEWYLSDDGSFELRSYAGAYGLVCNSSSPGPSGWLIPEKNFVHVKAVRVSDDAVHSYDFWLPVSNVQRLGFSPLIQSGFFAMDTTTETVDGECIWTLTPETPQYQHAKTVFALPYFRIRELDSELNTLMLT